MRATFVTITQFMLKIAQHLQIAQHCRRKIDPFKISFRYVGIVNITQNINYSLLYSIKVFTISFSMFLGRDPTLGPNLNLRTGIALGTRLGPVLPRTLYYSFFFFFILALLQTLLITFVFPLVSFSTGTLSNTDVSGRGGRMEEGTSGGGSPNAGRGMGLCSAFSTSELMLAKVAKASSVSSA